MLLERFKVPEKDKVRVAESALRKIVTEIFEKVGVSHNDAVEGADVLVTTDLRGVESHGVSNALRSYVKDFQTGKLNPLSGWKLVRETPGAAVIDAERRLGVLLGSRAMGLAMKKAKSGGVGAVAMINSGHLGAIGHYAMIAAEHDMVGLCFGGSGLPKPSVVPTFASKPLFGTNPIAIAAPAGKEAPFLFDAATAAIAGNKIRLAARTGALLLPGWVADKKGNPIMKEVPVSHRHQYYLLPLGATREQGSHKGYGFTMMAEVLATLLSGGLPTMLDKASGSKSHFLAYNISAFTNSEHFKAAMDQMLEILRTTDPAAGFDRVLYPGLGEHEEMKRRKKYGIPLHKEVIQWFDGIGRELGICPLKTLP